MNEVLAGLAVVWVVFVFIVRIFILVLKVTFWIFMLPLMLFGFIPYALIRL